MTAEAALNVVALVAMLLAPLTLIYCVLKLLEDLVQRRRTLWMMGTISAIQAAAVIAYAGLLLATMPNLSI